MNAAFSQPSRQFPPVGASVLLPRRDKKCAILGLTLYTASRPLTYAGLNAAFLLAKLTGPGILPARRETLAVEEWDELQESWRDALGVVDSVAVHNRRDPRAGLTMLACRRGSAVALVKVRHSPEGILLEQDILGRLTARARGVVSFPAPLGHGTTESGTYWAAQEYVFRQPHRRVLELSPQALESLHAALREVFEASPLIAERPVDAHVEPAHGDLTPWNLRRDRGGRVWLFDWEDAGWAPPGADAAYLAMTACALRGGAPPRLSQDLTAYWRRLIAARVAQGHGQRMNEQLLRLLDDSSGTDSVPRPAG